MGRVWVKVGVGKEAVQGFLQKQKNGAAKTQAEGRLNALQGTVTGLKRELAKAAKEPDPKSKSQPGRGKKKPAAKRINPREVQKQKDQGLTQLGQLGEALASFCESVGCDLCKDLWGIASDAAQHYILELTSTVKYTVKDRGFREGDCFKGGPGERICARDLIGMEFEHPVVKGMTFRFENKSAKVKGQSERGIKTMYKESAWSHFAAGKLKDLPGHVINGDWNGPGRLPGFAGLKILKGPGPFLNLVPLDKTVNDRGTYNRHEENVKTWAPESDVLCVRITFKYGDSEYPARPTTFKWEFIRKKDGMWQPPTPGTDQPNT
jgi:hypothetical protein